VTDALLGAAALGDIGELFPTSDPANRGRDSGEMLQLVHDRVAEAGYRIVNLDCVVHAENPKLTPHKAKIKARIAELLGLNIDQVGLKAKTAEGLGPVGTGEAIDATCVALLETVK
jgi:2-C-methyl-D-erythritol 2,4-cyclodiphosphate synthase